MEQKEPEKTTGWRVGPYLFGLALFLLISQFTRGSGILPGALLAALCLGVVPNILNGSIKFGSVRKRREQERLEQERVEQAWHDYEHVKRQQRGHVK